MAISSLSFYQDNKVGDSNLMPIHSPLIFLVDAVYDTEDPYYIYCKVYNESDQLLDTFKCLPYKDITVTQRRFMFIADSILRGYMESFEDFAQTNNTLEYVEDITKRFKLVFSDPDENATDIELEIVAIHGVSQFGEHPNKSNIYNNEAETIIGISGKPCYIYFYNNDEDNILSLDVVYGARFIVSDISGFLQNADVTITGVGTYQTNSGGEVFIDLSSGTYNYTVSKFGYSPQTGSFTIADNYLVISVTLTELSYSDVTFHIEYDGSDLENISVQIKDQSTGTVLFTGLTNSSGDFTQSLPYGTYTIVTGVSPGFYPWFLKSNTHNITVNTPTYTDNVIVILKDLYNVKFIVTDASLNPIQGATIGGLFYVLYNMSNDYFGNQSSLLTTDVNGEVTIQEITGSYDYGIKKSGYTSKTGNVTVISSNVEVNIIMT